MESYKNLGRNANVIAYEVGSDWIKVQFRDGSIYTYIYQSAGQTNIEHMKKTGDCGAWAQQLHK